MRRVGVEREYRSCWWERATGYLVPRTPTTLVSLWDTDAEGTGTNPGDEHPRRWEGTPYRDARRRRLHVRGRYSPAPHTPRPSLSFASLVQSWTLAVPAVGTPSPLGEYYEVAPDWRRLQRHITLPIQTRPAFSGGEGKRVCHPAFACRASAVALVLKGRCDRRYLLLQGEGRG